MNIAKALKHKITNHSRIFDETLDIYNDVLIFIIHVIETEFEDVHAYTSKQMLTAVERLIHATKANPHPKYGDFGKKYYKFPSYLRREAINTAFGKVKSYRSNFKN